MPRTDLDDGLTGISNVAGDQVNPATEETLALILSGGGPLTPASPTFATVGVASAQAVASNLNRTGLVLVNTSANTIYIGLGAAAVIDSGITIYPHGSWEMDKYTFTTAAINAIATAVGSNLTIQEFN